MNKSQVVKQIAKHVKNELSGESTGHDWWHIERVLKIAKKIAREESADLFIIQIAALLHDIYDHKFYNQKQAKQKINKFLEKFQIPPELIEQISYIILNMSYEGGTNLHKMKTIEGQIVQDADRLDALGAIGIARAFAYGGKVSREIYNPQIKPRKYKDLKEYKKHIRDNPTLNHFYEKLLLLKNQLNTKSAKKIALNRHRFMKIFLKQFFEEWEGKQ